MPDLLLTAADTATRAAALAQVRLALTMIAADPVARSLAHPSAGAPTGSATLADWLYAHWWCGPGLGSQAAEPGSAPTHPSAGQDRAEHGAARLEAARRATAPQSTGWLVLAAVGDVVVAARLAQDEAGAHDRRVTTAPDAVVSSSRPGLAPRPGDLVTLRHGVAGLDPTQAWWWAHSTRPEALADLPLDRWYVHARDLSAATRLVPLLLAVVAEADCPVSLKCPPVEAGYGRRDALVVYLPRDRRIPAEQALLLRAAEIDQLVRHDVPPLTRPLLPGVARAEDPGQDDADDPVSYGQLRCRQVAAIATTLLSAGSRSGVPWCTDDDLVAALTGVGIDVDAVERVA